MVDKQRLNTYRSINNWHNFRLRLFGEGILVGLVSGLVVGFFRFALNFVEAQRGLVYTYLASHDWTMTLLWFFVLLLSAALLHFLVAYEPLSAGSGIPQVKGAILGFIKMNWLRVLWTKLIGGIIGIGAGLSLGREGPSIQLGAMAAQGISRLFGRSRMEERYLLTSGASAGLAAAFNAPLAGVIFSLEELHHNFSAVVLLPAMAAALTSTAVSQLIFSSATIFNFVDLPVMPLRYFGLTIVLGVVLGVFGTIFNYCLINVSMFYRLPFFKNTFSRVSFALVIAGILGFYLPQVLGGGSELIETISQTRLSLTAISVVLCAKFIFTMLSYGSGVPGGFFLPMLVIGALAGNLTASLMSDWGFLNPYFHQDMVVFSMAAFFSASVRAPITGTILVMEMTGSFEHLFPLVIASISAYLTAEVFKNEPIYDRLLQRTLDGISRQDKDAVPNKTRNIIELSIPSGCALDGRLIKNINWPEHTLLVDIKRGEKDLVPNGETLLLAGDYLYVLTDNANASAVRGLAEGNR
ncbi:MAG: ClC family H(+)/Cl(-) exchange transporter [Acidaminococcaceae bacterium]|nr:ClC family H(+)/Cl(-) exchange transporter [Acidaminococcaceae bacterium]